MSDEAVRAKTGRTWPEWFAALDAAGAAGMTHKEIVAHLDAEHRLGPWWRQMVTVTYEQARGLRDRHERPDGYAISASKTLPVPVAALYRAFADERSREQWLPGGALAVHKATPGKSLRGTWQGGGRVEVNFYAKGDRKSQVTLDHGRLETAEQAARVKAHWAERFAALADWIQSGGA